MRRTGARCSPAGSNPQRASTYCASGSGTTRRKALRMWRLSPLTGWVKKHSGSSGQLAGVHLPQGRPGRASRKRGRVTAATGRCMEPMRRCLVNDRERQRLVRHPGKALPAAIKRVARGVGIAAVQFKRRPPKQRTTCTANEVHRDGSAKAGASESSTLSSLLATRMGGGGLTEALIRARRCLAASQTPPGGS